MCCESVQCLIIASQAPFNDNIYEFFFVNLNIKDIEYIKELDESGDYSYETIVDRSSSPSDYFKSGTTATVMVIEDGYCVYYCWVGDSRAILCRNGVPKRLTFEHSLDKKDNPLLENEIKRISNAGGEINVENNGLTRYLTFA